MGAHHGVYVSGARVRHIGQRRRQPRAPPAARPPRVLEGQQRRGAVQRDVRQPSQPLRQHRAAGEEEVCQQHVRAKALLPNPGTSSNASRCSMASVHERHNPA